MDIDDQPFGIIRNGVIVLSGNSPSVTVAGGALVVADGPTAWLSRAEPPPVKDRMVTRRFTRAEAAGGALRRIVITTHRGGFVSLPALAWLHGVGCAVSMVDYDGALFFSSAPSGPDQPALRRAQALAAGGETGHAIAREILRVKLKGQAAVARLLGRSETAELIVNLAGELDSASDSVRAMAIEAMAATAYWPLWVAVPLRFARKDQIPGHWRTFGGRHSPLSGKPLRAASPGNSLANYLYAVAVGEMTIALTGAGLDPGIGIFHADRDRRASLAYDAIEVLRSYVDAWLLAWLATAHFSKRDFYEERDGTVRITRPLTSHLAMTAAIWRPAAQAVAGWLAGALGATVSNDRRLPPPFPALPAPKRTWQGLEPPIPRTCQECGKALAPRQRKFCSEACSIAFHVATTTAAELTALPAFPAAGALSDEDASDRGGGSKNRKHLALRRAWDAEHPPSKVAAKAAKAHGRNTWAVPTSEHLRSWFATTLAPLLSTRHHSEIQRVTGLSKRYAIMIRQGSPPHPRHYRTLAELVGVQPPD